MDDQDDHGLEFFVHVRPGARHNRIDGPFSGVLAVRVTAPAEDGRANDAVREVLGDGFGTRSGAVQIRSGHTSRRKRVRVAGNRAALSARLDRLMGNRP